RKGFLMRTIHKFFWLGLLVQVALSPAIGADVEFKAGGAVLTLPGPPNDFVEAGDKLRTTLFELLVPTVNRLLSAYIPEHSFVDLNAGKANGGLEVYAMVEVPRQAGYADCTPENFAQVLKSVEPALGS